MSIATRIARSTVVGLGLLGLLPAADGAWDRLPAETVAAIHVADGSAVAEAFTATRFGQVLFAEERAAALEDLLETFAGSTMDAIEGGLAEYDLTHDDLLGLFAGDTGLALQVLPPMGEAGEPRLTALAWITPGEEIATKVAAALDRMVVEQMENAGGQQFARFEEDLDGHAVLHYTRRTESVTFEWDQASGKAVEVRRLGDPEHLFVHHADGRIAFAFAEDAALIDVSQSFTDLIAGVDLGGGSFAARLDSVLGLDEARPAGQEIFEFAGNLAPLWEILALQDSIGELTGEQFVAAAGLETVSAVQMGAALDGDLARWSAFLAAPAPRTGLVRLLDQPPATTGVPAWVPAEVLQFSRMGVDMGTSFQIFRDFMITVGGQDLARGFQMADAQMPAMFGVADLATLFGGLGNDLSYLRLPLGGEPDPSGMGRLGMVWSLADAGVWETFVQRLGQLAVGQGMPAEIDDGEGYSGFIVDFSLFSPEAPTVSMHVANGHLVVCFGADVASELVPRIVAPPEEAADGFAAGPVYQRGGELVALDDPAWVWDVSDLDAQMVDVGTFLREVMLGQLPLGPEQEQAMSVLLPMPHELEGTLGVQASRMVVDAAGLVLEAVSEMPRAEPAAEE